MKPKQLSQRIRNRCQFFPLCELDEYVAPSITASLFENLQLEQDVETVVRALQPGPLGIVEHKFTAEEINRANLTVKKAVENWQRTAYNEKNSPILKDFIDDVTFDFQNPR